MKYYRPIASYDGAGDIKELFPFDITRKLEAATNVVNYYLNGSGNPHEIAGDDEEARIYPDEMDVYGLVPVIGDYAVSFIPGDKEVLFGDGKGAHGYFIDIYQLVSPGTEPDFPEPDYCYTVEEEDEALSHEAESNYLNYGPDKPGRGWMEAEEN